MRFITGVIILITGLTAMAADNSQIEDPSYVEERIQAHKTHYTGADMPENYALYFSAARVKSKNLHNLAGVSAASAETLKHDLLDGLDISQVSRAATADLIDELCKRVDADDPDIVSMAAMLDKIKETELTAVANRYKATMQKLDTASFRAISAELDSDLSKTTTARVDYAGLAQDVPNYVRRMLRNDCFYLRSPPKKPRHLDTQEQQSWPSDEFRIESHSGE